MTNNKDLDSLIREMGNNSEMPVQLFGDMKYEQPFSGDPKAFTQDGTDNSEFTLIGSSTVIDSNITCGGNIVVKGQVKGNMSIAGSADIFGIIDGDIDANEIRLESGAKINGNLTCKSDVHVMAGSFVVGNITAKNVYVDSSVEGNVEATGQVMFSGTGSIVGDIVTGQIAAAIGTAINGKISIKK